MLCAGPAFKIHFCVCVCPYRAREQAPCEQISRERTYTERERGRGRGRAYTIFDCWPYEWAMLLVWATGSDSGSGCSVTKANGSREWGAERARERGSEQSGVRVEYERARESIGI